MARWPHTSAWSADQRGEASRAPATAAALGSGGAVPSNTDAAPPTQATSTAVARSEWITSIRARARRPSARRLAWLLLWAGGGAHRVPPAKRSNTSKTPRCRRT